jgi:uncharacterized small protein (DUF1192 family)
VSTVTETAADPGGEALRLVSEAYGRIAELREELAALRAELAEQVTTRRLVVVDERAGRWCTRISWPGRSS